MKKVCIITTVHPLFDSRIFYKEARSLAEAGYNVTMIVQHDRDEIIEGIKIISLEKPKNRFSRMFFLGKKAFDLALAEKADIYHFHDPELLFWMAKLKKVTGARVIFDIHENVPKDILSKEWLPSFFRKIVASVYSSYEKKVINLFDCVIAATPDIASRYKNAVIIYNYPIVSNDNPDKADFQENDKASHAIFVGALSEVRGIAQIVNALKYIPENRIKLSIIGAFSEASFEKEIRELSDWIKVDYPGVLPQEQAYAKMKDSGMGLICFLPDPNHVNAMPNKIFEYMAAGIPVIASNFSLWLNIVEKNKCGIMVNPEDPAEIAKAMLYLAEHPQEAQVMGTNGRFAVLEKYNWKTESAKLLELYNKLCAE